ncbi:phage minor head protein [Streptomyces sp. CA-253872]|uniref:phage minor head protein n=1 Tax=Streptomyces sp. CA-253872 TaxID=3240067 RepID=UPI003D926791
MSNSEARLREAEDDVAGTVRDVLDDVAEEFARAVSGADELVAARFSVGSIARMWAQRVPRIVRRLLGVAETAASDAADTVGGTLGDDWRDLPGRYDDGRKLPGDLGAYVDVTEHLLRAVGNRLAEAAREELADGLAAGNTVAQLRDRLKARFAADGAQLGPGREARTAATEASRAWNTATLEAARAMSSPDRPLVKQWRTRGDARVRDAHHDADGQVQLLDDPFRVGGTDMMQPGDPTAPASLTVNCRCQLRLSRGVENASAAVDPKTPTRTVSFTAKDTVGVGPSDRRERVAAADGSHLRGGMIALLPTPADAERLAIEGGEAPSDLHLTLYFLGDEGGDWAPEQRQELADAVRSLTDGLGPVPASAFGASHWNPHSDSPSWVWSVGDDPDADPDAPGLEQVRALVMRALDDTPDRPDVPRQHSPWVAHVCAAYSDDPALLGALLDRVGPLAFDRLRLAVGGDHIDIPLTTEEEPVSDEETAAGMPTRAWSTPGDTGLAFENQETGDGRIFAPGALEWDGPGPWPLQYADEMMGGHDGAELAGAINTLGRDGDRITADGVLYLTQRAGVEAAMLLEEEAPLGVSVDLDDVDVEFVDRSLGDDGEPLALAASLASLSVLPLDDGSWALTARPAAEWTASHGGTLARQRRTAQLITGPGGRVTARALTAAFAGTGLLPDALTAAAGDPDDPDNGVVVHTETSGELLFRITRARLRGATLVAVPAFAGARIVLDPREDDPGEETAASVAAGGVTAAADTRSGVVHYVRASPAPVGAPDVARALGISVSTARRYLGEAVKAGELVRLRPGLYIGATSRPGEETTASAVEETGEGHVHYGSDDVLGDLAASAWTAMQDADPMPAAWFREPTAEELPPGSGGVHYAGGRIYGWVAQAGEPHAGYPGRNLTIESLGALDMTHFLRARFKLDDGSYVKAGAFTMNAPHGRDGAECDTASCQFDDTRTVAGVITVGLSDGGLWFSGAAAPWLSSWDRTVFTACQPSYHMRQAASGRWQLRAVLSVPVPGHSSPLIAAAVERSNLALAASAAGAFPAALATTTPTPAPVAAPSVAAADRGVSAPQTPAAAPTAEEAAEQLVAALTARPEALDALHAALTARQTTREEERRAEVERLAAVFTPTPATTTF